VIQLRPYQQQLVNEIRGQYQLGHRSVLAVLSTGAGKTICFSHIAQSAAKRGNRVCILVHRAELLEQASNSHSADGCAAWIDRCQSQHGSEPCGAGSKRANIGAQAA